MAFIFQILGDGSLKIRGESRIESIIGLIRHVYIIACVQEYQKKKRGEGIPRETFVVLGLREDLDLQMV